MYKKELNWVPFFGWAIAQLDMVHIDRSKRAQAFNKAAEKAGISKRMTSTGVSSKSTESLAQRAGATGSGSLGSAMGQADKRRIAMPRSWARADLPVFLRQSHAERDLASLGTGLLPEEESPWKL